MNELKDELRSKEILSYEEKSEIAQHYVDEANKTDWRDILQSYELEQCETNEDIMILCDNRMMEYSQTPDYFDRVEQKMDLYLKSTFIMFFILGILMSVSLFFNITLLEYIKNFLNVVK